MTPTRDPLAECQDVIATILREYPQIKGSLYARAYNSLVAHPSPPAEAPGLTELDAEIEAAKTNVERFQDEPTLAVKYAGILWGMEEARRILRAALRSRGEAWISVEDREPVCGQDVAFIVDCPDDPTYHGRELGGRYIGGHEFSTPGVVWRASLWRDMPTPPKETQV